MIAAALLAANVTHAVAQHGPAPAQPPRTYTTTPVAPAAAAEWRADLKQLVTELERNHPDPFNETPRTVFLDAVAKLDRRIPELAAHEIIVEFERLVALVGDGHTNINMLNSAGVDFHVLPLRFGFYSDGVYIEAADASYAGAVGGRVVAIEDTPIDSVMARIRPLVSRDNDEWVAVATPHLMSLIEVLHALRIAKGLDGVRVRVMQDGRAVNVDVKPLAETRTRPGGYPLRSTYTGTWMDAMTAAAGIAPLYQQRLDSIYGWQYVPKDRVLYIWWNQVQNRAQGESALGMFQDALAYAREHASEIDKVLIDVRNNTGGEGGLLDPIVREIIRTREIDEAGRLFVAIGPRTFSAALIMAVQLDRYTDATFVGEPTGGKPNVYAGHVVVTLRNSGIGVSISPAFYQSGFPSDVREFVAPRLYVKPSFADYRAGRDPVYDAVVKYRAPVLGAEVERLAATGDTAGAEALVRRYASDPINRYNGATGITNAAGYRLLRAGDPVAALRVFRLNVRVHPDYANGWDSLGEAYADSGDRVNAIMAFEQLLKLEPNNGRAREFLLRLKT